MSAENRLKPSNSPSVHCTGGSATYCTGYFTSLVFRSTSFLSTGSILIAKNIAFWADRFINRNALIFPTKAIMTVTVSPKITYLIQARTEVNKTGTHKHLISDTTYTIIAFRTKCKRTPPYIRLVRKIRRNTNCWDLLPKC